MQIFSTTLSSANLSTHADELLCAAVYAALAGLLRLRRSRCAMN
jgi:hypothetical protein